MTSDSLPDVCPLCARVFPREQLFDHISSERPVLRQTTIKVIQAYHPTWLAEQGACEPCWKSFRDAGRVLRMLKGAHRPTAIDYWTRAEPVEGSRSPDQTGHRTVY